MSKEGCYRCGSGGHKFFECQESENGSIKKQVKLDQRLSVTKDPIKSLDKWKERQRAKEIILPVSAHQTQH